MEEFRCYKSQSSQFPLLERRTFDVFLSFRGPDVRKTMADHLYQSLTTAGLNVFRDSEKLEKGEDIGMSLQQAIQNSTIHIPIFSPNYASSVWCLREVQLMWNLKSTGAHIMIPLFYNVEPSHVRHVGGSYAEAFAKHQTHGRYSADVIKGWRDVLHKVSCLSGWSLEIFSGYEGKLVAQVLEDVQQSLDLGMQDVAEHTVGLKSCIEELQQSLKLGDETSDQLSIGIWGMTGLGKTNLSKALYNEIRRLFGASSFVSNVKLEDSRHCLIKLQQKILEDLLKTQIKVTDIDHGKILMRNRLASIKALVVLDDVDHVRQLDALMGDWFGEGSRVVITTQNERVLKVRQVDVIYPMKELEFAEAMELFCWHAFRSEHPKSGYEDMAERIVKNCSGLPLALEIIGGELFGRDKTRYWPEVLHNLETVGHDSVFKTLKISYDNLSPVEKHIFLDIACLFIEIKSSDFIQNRTFSTDFYVRFWRAFGCWSVIASLETLKEKGLIVMHEHSYKVGIDDDVDEDDKGVKFFWEFSMHDQIRDMGRRIVLEESLNDPSKRSRVWREEDIRRLMAATTIQENNNIEGLMWRRRMELQHIHSLASLQRLGFLLWWELQVKTQIERLPTNLKYLVLSECHLKEYNAQMAGTERTTEHNGSSALSPVLPESIAQLKYLTYLDMSGTKLTCLPKEIGELNCLEELYLSRCSLEALPETFGNLIRLKFLDVSNNFLSEFPPSFELLKSLVNLEIAQNEQLVVFPALPENLTALSARGCSKLQSMSLENDMKSLMTMDLSHCDSLTGLPTLIGCISLRYLRLDGCKELDKLYLPDCLAYLSISGCSKLQEVFSNAPFASLPRDRTENRVRPSGLPEPSPVGFFRPLRDLSSPSCLPQVPSHSRSPPEPAPPLPPLPPEPAPLLPVPSPLLPEPSPVRFFQPTSLFPNRSFPPGPARQLQLLSSRPASLFPHPPSSFICPSEIKEVCMIGCHNIRLNIYQLLKDFRGLERLDLSVSSEAVNESQPLIGQKNLTLQSDSFCVAAFFFFVVERDENVRLPQMDVLMTFLSDFDGSLLSKTFEVPSRMKGDCSGRFIMRVCTWHIRSFAKRGTASCSYCVKDRLSQQENPVFLRHMEFLALKEVSLSENVMHFLQLWGLLSASNDIKRKELEEREAYF